MHKPIIILLLLFFSSLLVLPVRADAPSYDFVCYPMKIPPHSLAPVIKLYQTSPKIRDDLFVGGFNFTSRGQVSTYLRQSQVHDPTYVFSTEADKDGSFFQSIHLGENLQPWMQYEVKAVDGMSNKSSVWLNFTLTEGVSTPITMRSTYFTWQISNETWYNVNRQAIDELMSFADDNYVAYARDFGYLVNGEVTIHITHTDDGLRGLFVGAASRNTIGLTGNTALNNSLSRSFLSHELANLFLGETSNGWPWSDGRGMWLELGSNGRNASPFPYIASVMALRELGYWNLSDTKLNRSKYDCGSQLLYTIFQAYGWSAYRTLFQYMRNYNVNLDQYSDSMKNAIVFYLLSVGTGTNLVTTFNTTLNIRNTSLSANDLTTATNLFKDLPNLTMLQASNIAVLREGIPVPELTWMNPIMLLIVMVAFTLIKRRKLRALSKVRDTN